MSYTINMVIIESTPIITVLVRVTRGGMKQVLPSRKNTSGITDIMIHIHPRLQHFTLPFRHISMGLRLHLRRISRMVLQCLHT